VHPFVFNSRFEAKTILQKLDARFDPRVFFVAFPLAKGKSLVGVGPEDTPFRPANFSNVLSRMTEFEKEDPEYGSYWAPDPTHGWTPSHERLQNSKVRKIRTRAFRKALSGAVDAAPANKGFVAYCGWPVEYNGDEILMILQLQRDVHDAYYHLKRGRYCDRGGLHEYHLDRSLIERSPSSTSGALAKNSRRSDPARA
jgi:hypothetical protein